MIKIAFWKKDSGNYLSASKGLNEQDIEFLKSLKPGDRLILLQSTRRFSHSTPDLVLTKFEGIKKVEEEDDLGI